MPPRATLRRPRVVFTTKRKNMTSSSSIDRTPTSALDELIDPESRIQELSSASNVDEDEYDNKSSSDITDPGIGGIQTAQNLAPSIYITLPLIQDELKTETSQAQDKVAELCRKLMSGEEQGLKNRNSHGIPRVLKERHEAFLENVLGQYPPQFQVMDASRPWLAYWALAGLAHLGKDVSVYRERTIQTFTPLQNATGGFGGGHGQTSHAAPSYAATLSLALVGALDIIDRRTMWHFLGSIKQADGSFTMAVGGEKDVRGAYCAMTIVNLLNLPLGLPKGSPGLSHGDETFASNLGEWIGRCQTYEGGIGGAPDNEAHGAYAFCGLACLCILDAPHRSISHHLNLPKLISWLSSRQTAPEGGFSGRTNKLVDACYSHWVGGCWPLVEAALNNRQSRAGVSDPCLWNREGLVRYTLCCSQTKNGGLRDKPGTRQDGYHSCYSLAGLSAAQHHWHYNDDEGLHEAGLHQAGSRPLSAAFQWEPRPTNDAEKDALLLDEQDMIELVHPVFVISYKAALDAKSQFSNRNTWS